ncbi:hypothetical protein [Baaleninema sp.]|uniref:hypothetical protein n=1 Tax=Baaleninema sp. TaxID=3101197 RepID=UPI003D058F4D
MQGLFVGLTTLDVIYLSERLPQPDEKLVASDYTIAAGGPATNAAVSFSSLGISSKVAACPCESFGTRSWLNGRSSC